ncbi:MAG: transcription elongation factor GreA [Chloroflexi bacterium CG07_land_8_20_14_0_80_51_10]|nr:MAG: transcription elongation factor GreA [Chloroflexi bacterium CG07_land_8_20_14_0_80_51_10]
MPEEKVLLTAEGLEKLKFELDRLREVRRPEVLERLQRAKELSDTVDNAEYEEAKNEQGFVEGRIMTLERMIKNAEVIPADKSRPAYVRFGSKVTITNQDGEERKYTIVGRAESNPNEGKISNESPVGKALLGKHVGEEVEIEVPKGLVKLKVLAISKK